MKYSEARRGRTFVVRLEDGDIVHECIEQLARDESIRAAAVICVGGADTGSRIVVGPEHPRAHQVNPMTLELDGVYEIAGTGTIFPDDTGTPVLHMHIAGGRGEATRAGCVRTGVKVWHVLEVIVMELTDTDATRAPDPTTGFKLLEP